MVYEVLFVETVVEQGLSSQDPRQQSFKRLTWKRGG